MYEIEEKILNALSRADFIVEQNNMLKNRITLLESKDILDTVGLDEENQFKDFQDKINLLMNKSDPLQTIKNSQDNSHFLIMKKLNQIASQRQLYETKYKKIKVKFSKKTEENITLEESNKIMKGIRAQIEASPQNKVQVQNQQNFKIKIRDCQMNFNQLKLNSQQSNKPIEEYIKNSESQISNSTSTGQYRFVPTSSFANIQNDSGILKAYSNIKSSNLNEERRSNLEIINENRNKQQKFSGGNYDFSYNKSYINSSGNNLNINKQVLNV